MASSSSRMPLAGACTLLSALLQVRNPKAVGRAWGNAVLGSQHMRWFKNTAHACSLLGHCLFLSLVGLIPSEIIVHLFGRPSAKSNYFLLSGEWLCEKMWFPCFQRQDSLWQRNGILWRSRSRLSPTLLFVSLLLCLSSPSQLTNPWLFSARLCVSYLRLQQRGLSGRLPR